MKPEQEQVRNLLTDTVSLLCKNSLFYNDELRVEGVIGVTLDNSDVFIIHINEKFGGSPVEGEGSSKKERSSQSTSKQDAQGKKIRSDRDDGHGTVTENSRSSSNRSTPTGCSQSSTQESLSRMKVKRELVDEDDDLMIVEKIEPDMRSQCRMQSSKSTSNREQRVPPLHGPPGPVEMETMRSYPNYNQSGTPNRTSGQMGQLQNASLGEPAAKRRASDSGSGPMITGMVPNMHQPNTDNSTAWAIGTGIPPDLAAQLAKPDGQVSLEQLTSSSSQPIITPQGALDQMVGTPYFL